MKLRQKKALNKCIRRTLVHPSLLRSKLKIRKSVRVYHQGINQKIRTSNYKGKIHKLTELTLAAPQLIRPATWMTLSLAVLIGALTLRATCRLYRLTTPTNQCPPHLQANLFKLDQQLQLIKKIRKLSQCKALLSRSAANTLQMTSFCTSRRTRSSCGASLTMRWSARFRLIQGWSTQPPPKCLPTTGPSLTATNSHLSTESESTWNEKLLL